MSKAKNKKKKVILAIADVGGGHRAPAEALQQVFEKKYPEQFSVEIVDLYAISDVAPFNTSESSYKLVTQNWTLEKINNFIFQLSNNFYGIFAEYIRDRLHQSFLEIIKSEKPDILLSNHPIVSTALHGVKLEWDNFFYISQITDAEIFLKGCMDKAADMVIAPTFEAYKQSRMYGVDKSCLIYPYFSLKPSLFQPTDKESFVVGMGLDPSKPTIFLTGGGVGIKGLQNAISALSGNDKWQLIVSAGKLEGIKQKLQRTYRKQKNIKIIGFVDNIQDYYSAADIIVTKPGMSSMLEAIAFNKKCILTHPVAMQEIGNVKYALQFTNFRFVDRQWDKLPELVEDLLDENTEFLDEAGRVMAPARNPMESEIIVDTIVSRFSKWEKHRLFKNRS